ncbi:DUF2474 domain-containing protein [Stutzerimonas urumqiensis]
MKRRWSQLGWFVGLWCAGVIAISLLAYGIRWAMGIS